MAFHTPRYWALIVCIVPVASLMAAPPPPASRPSGALVRDVMLWNGSFTDGGESPAQWSKEGQVVVARDVRVFKEAPASLRIDASGSAGDAVQWVELAGPRSFKLRGFLKTSGEVKAQVVVQSIDEKWTRNEWNQIKFAAGDSDWRSFEKQVAVPPWAARFRVMLHVEGKGSAWMDEVAVGEGPALAGRQLNPSVDEPPEGKPWEPAWCVWAWRSAWVAQHENFVGRTGKGHVDIIFYGDSITMGWKNRWEETFAPLKAVNYGIGGDSTRQLLWRIGHGELDGSTPKLVVLMVGTNNLYGDRNAGSDEEIAKGVKAVVSLLGEKLPRTRILLCAILPRQNEYFCNRIKAINAMIQPLADGEHVRWLDMREVFMKVEPGSVKNELFVEPGNAALHPNDKGYDAMTAVMTPVIREMLK